MKTLVAYRNNDLFEAYLPEILKDKKIETIVFPRGTSEEKIKERMSDEIKKYDKDEDIFILDGTVSYILSFNLSVCPKNLKNIDEMFRKTFCKTETQKDFLDSFEYFLEVLNPERKPLVIVQEGLTSHMPKWYMNIYTYLLNRYTGSVDEKRSFIQEEKTIEKCQGFFFDKTHFFSELEQKMKFITFLKDKLSLEIRVVETTGEVRSGEFMIIDRHADYSDQHAEKDKLILPLEGSVAKMSHGNIDKKILSKLVELLEL